MNNFFKNIISKTIKLFFFILSPLILSLIFIIYPFKKIRIGSLPTQRIGHLSQETELYLSSKKKKYFDIFFTQKKICNLTLYFLIKKKLFILSGDILWPIFILIKKLSIYSNFFDNFLIKTSVLDSLNKFSNKRKFKLEKSQIEKGENFLNKIGINKRDKIVLLCIRDGKYLKKNFLKNYTYHNYRNCSPKNFKSAIDHLLKKGYYVFRMGQDTKDNLNINHKNFINYSKYYRNDFMDIYLSYRCEFNISTSTGIDGVSSYIFKKPLLVTNIVPLKDISQYATSKIFFLLFKEYMNVRNNKKLNFSEIKKKKLFNLYTSNEFERAEIKLIENDKLTIKNSVKEMIEVLKKRKKINSSFFWKKYEEIFETTKQGLYKKSVANVSKNFIEKRVYLLK